MQTVRWPKARGLALQDRRLICTDCRGVQRNRNATSWIPTMLGKMRTRPTNIHRAQPGSVHRTAKYANGIATSRKPSEVKLPSTSPGPKAKAADIEITTLATTKAKSKTVFSGDSRGELTASPRYPMGIPCLRP